jgi:hypothetical protein
VSAGFALVMFDGARVSRKLAANAAPLLLKDERA